MAPVLNHLFAREESDDSSLNPTMVKLLIALLVLVFVAICSVGALYALRMVRRSRQSNGENLPMYNEKSAGYSPKNHRRLTITAQPSGKRGESVYVIQEKQNLMASSSSPPPSPIPEIRITFPDEEGDGGKRQSGRVVVVRVGDHSIGMEPVQEKDDLPPYMRDEARFQSLDLDRMGGLKEKDMN